jgi:hypothetical protein
MPWAVRMMLMIALAGLLVQWYVARKAVNAISLATGLKKRSVKITAVAFLAWTVLYPLLAAGSYWARWGSISQALQRSNLFVDALITYPFWVGVILAGQLALILVAIDLLRLVLVPLTRRRRDWWARRYAWLVTALIAAGAVYVPARVYNDSFNVRTRQTEFRIAGLPQELDGFRIVHLADIQVDGRTNGNKLRSYIERAKGLNPDLVLFGGDLVTSGTDHIEAAASAMGKIEARRGIYAALGDHDHFSDKTRVIASLEKNGITVLDNLATVVPVGSTFLSLTGVTNVYRTRPSEATLETIERQRPKGSVEILLTHQPSNWLVEFARDNGYDLFLAGHTHGGQVAFRLPGLRLAGSALETDYISGFYEVGNMLVSVTNGLGFTLAPVRYHAPAEVTLIVLKRGE